MRGGLKLNPSQLAALVGPEFCEALASGEIELKVREKVYTSKSQTHGNARVLY